MKIKNKKKGFTLMETAVTLMLLATLSLAIGTAYSSIIKIRYKNSVQMKMIFYTFSQNEEAVAVTGTTPDGIQYSTTKTLDAVLNMYLVETTVVYEGKTYYYKRFLRGV